MQHSFWHEKWKSNQIGFHLDETNKLLIKHWPSLGVPKGCTVFVPLCGKTLDLVWLRSEGYSVIGVELSEIALDELADSITETLGLEVTKTTLEQEGLTAKYEADGVLLYAGDFFALTRSILGDVTAVYDRAALVALPADMRVEYCHHLQEITQQAPQLIFSFDYDQNVMSGPPFSVPAVELHMNYHSYYKNIELLEIREIIEHQPNFKERGLTSFKQLVYLLR